MKHRDATIWSRTTCVENSVDWTCGLDISLRTESTDRHTSQFTSLPVRPVALYPVQVNVESYSPGGVNVQPELTRRSFDVPQSPLQTTSLVSLYRVVFTVVETREGDLKFYLCLLFQHSNLRDLPTAIEEIIVDICRIYLGSSVISRSYSGKPLSFYGEGGSKI